jgi:hypothetical protein
MQDVFCSGRCLRFEILIIHPNRGRTPNPFLLSFLTKRMTGTLVKIQLDVTRRKESSRVICEENRDQMHRVGESDGGTG